VKRLGSSGSDLPQEVGLRLDVGVERALLDAERLGEVADRGAVVALLGEESGGGAGQLCAAGGDSATLTIVRLGHHQETAVAAVEVPRSEQAFLEYLQAGGQVETTDWLPDDYRAKLVKFIEMHGNSELMGVLPEREWILRAPTLQRKLALTAKVQDEVGHAQMIYRVVDDLGKPREQCLADLISGKSKFHNVFHYPTKTWGDVGVIAWLVDAAAIISQKALLKCSYAPYARIMKKICWEESFHILHGRDVILAMVTGTPEQFELVQEAVNRWWGPLMQFHGNPIPKEEDPMFQWRIKSQGNEEARQQFLDGYVPQVLELGLTVPDPKLRKRDDGVWEYTEPDWDELKRVVTGHGPRTAERLAFRARFIEQERWVRDAVLAA
jgi:ring-1,2-phenylacetyl-CoA epoxidase subunit PaaA